MESGCKQSNDFYLLQPELLNETALKQILELVSIKLTDYDSTDIMFCSISLQV
jgi:hypothetical protein